MKSYEAIGKLVREKAVEFAKRMGLSSRRIYQLMEPSADFTDSGTANPLDRLETMMEIGLALGHPREDVFSPIQYLAERFGLIVLPAPTPAIKIETLQEELLKTIAEFSDLTKAASQAMTDGQITRKESKNIKKEGWELIRQTAAFMQTVSGEKI